MAQTRPFEARGQTPTGVRAEPLGSGEARGDSPSFPIASFSSSSPWEARLQGTRTQALRSRAVTGLWGAPAGRRAESRRARRPGSVSSPSRPLLLRSCPHSRRRGPEAPKAMTQASLCVAGTPGTGLALFSEPGRRFVFFFLKHIEVF